MASANPLNWQQMAGAQSTKAWPKSWGQSGAKPASNPLSAAHLGSRRWRWRWRWSRLSNQLSPKGGAPYPYLSVFPNVGMSECLKEKQEAEVLRDCRQLPEAKG